MVRVIALVLMLGSSALAAPPQGPKPAAAPQAVRFDDQTLTLSFEAGASGETLKEYLPQGQKLDSWTKLAAIREYPNLHDPLALAAGVLKQLKQDYPLSPSSIIQNPKTGEVIVDFIVWPEDASFVEFNIFKYQKRPDGGVSSQQYALREYKNQEAFLKSFRPVRRRLVELMAQQGLQIVAAPREAPQQKTGLASQ
jgi:hypothetical protein